MSVAGYGWPLPKRQHFFQELAGDPHSKRYGTELEFIGKKLNLPVYRIPIDLPKYRLANGRTSSLQQEWLAKNPSRPRDFFTKDPEREEAQKVQHQLLRELINEKSLLPYFQKPSNTQQGFLILDHLGFAVNGNRRICAWRELFNKDSKVYGHFAHIDVIILPKADDAAIDKLEGQLQLEPDILAGYSWHAFANMLLDRMICHKWDEKTLARFYDRKETEVREYIDMRNYAAEYLKARGRDGQWSEVTETEYAFRAMVRMRKQIPASGEKKLFEVGAFALLDAPEGGRLYEYIPDLFKYRSQVKARLLKEFPVALPPQPSDDLLQTDSTEMESQILAAKLEENGNKDIVANIIKDVIDTEDALERDRNSAEFVLLQLQKANTAIQSSLTAIHRPSTSKNGVAQTVKSIESGIESVKKWLNTNG